MIVVTVRGVRELSWPYHVSCVTMLVLHEMLDMTLNAARRAH